MMDRLMKVLQFIRAKHWIKNILILFPAFFGKRISGTWEDVLYMCTGILAFCLMSSSVYILNDMLDIDSDKCHPTKKKRPLASGQIKMSTARILVIFFVVLSLGISISLGWKNVICIIAYLGINLFYSMRLKDIPIVDVFILVSCYVIRIIYGALIFSVMISDWLLLTVVSASLFMSLGKRRNEVLLLKKAEMKKENIRRVFTKYTYEFLDKNMYIFITLTIMFYSLWSIDGADLERIYSVPVVMAILMRYSYNIEGNINGDPVEVLIGDKWLQVLSIIYIGIITYVIYW